MSIVRRVALLVIGGLAAAWALPTGPFAQSPTTYTVVTAENRRPLPFRTAGNADMVPLDQVATLFGLNVTEDAVLSGLSIDARGERILLVPDQSFAQVAGQVRNLSAPVRRERSGWHVPIDFLSVVGVALGTRIEVRRASHLVIVGDLRIPAVSVRLDRAGPNGRVTVDIAPPTPHRVTRDGNRLQVRFEAHSLDLGTVTGSAADFVTGVRVEGPALIVALGGEADTFRADSDPASRQLTIEVLPPGAPPPPAPAPTRPTPAPPAVELNTSGVIRTVVIDPGHGGDDTGVVGPGGATEKDLALQMARRLKSAIENRIGLRVILTRDIDARIPIDRRTATANTNKADLFLTLHVNGSPRSEVQGAQVISISADDYRDRFPATDPSSARVPTVGGGTRVIEAVPWELAQMPFADRSAAIASSLVRHLAAQRVPLFANPSDQLPLRVLVGANMPAVQLEMGFLTNPGEARALASADRANAIVEAVVAAIAENRRTSGATASAPGGGGSR